MCYRSRANRARSNTSLSLPVKVSTSIRLCAFKNVQTCGSIVAFFTLKPISVAVVLKTRTPTVTHVPEVSKSICFCCCSKLYRSACISNRSATPVLPKPSEKIPLKIDARASFCSANPSFAETLKCRKKATNGAVNPWQKVFNSKPNQKVTTNYLRVPDIQGTKKTNFVHRKNLFRGKISWYRASIKIRRRKKSKRSWKNAGKSRDHRDQLHKHSSRLTALLGLCRN